MNRYSIRVSKKLKSHKINDGFIMKLHRCAVSWPRIVQQKSEETMGTSIRFYLICCCSLISVSLIYLSALICLLSFGKMKVCRETRCLFRLISFGKVSAI